MILFIIIAILFIPFPLVVNVYLNKNTLKIKLLGITILHNNKNNKTNCLLNKFLRKRFESRSSKNAEPNNEKRNKNKHFSFNTFINNFSCNNLKPSIHLKGNMDYSLEDAAKTAIIYGLLYSFQGFLIIILNLVFNVKKNTFTITPKFTDNFFCKINLTSIIYLSFAHIIYMLFLVYKSFENLEEVSQNREYYGKRTSS